MASSGPPETASVPSKATTEASSAAYAPSPSPSPALSAYTSSSVSSLDDYDLNRLSLDDWGYPRRQTGGVGANADSTNNNGGPRLNTETLQRQEFLSGTSTPIAKDYRNYPFSLQRSQSSSTKEVKAGEGAEEEEDDDEEWVPSVDVEDEDEEDMHAHGVPAARGWRLKASKAKTPAFRSQVLSMFTTQLKLETWSDDTADPAVLPLKAENLELKRISGAFSNAVFFVSYKVPSDKQASGPRTVLLRVYGSGTEVLLSRRTELLILHTLSSLYEIGPHILGTFANGRVETYFDAEPIGKEGIRDLGDRRETLREDGSLLVRGREGRAQWVARRMRQLHEVPLETMRAVLEQGDLRPCSDTSSGLFGRGIENHLFARSHRPLNSRARRSSTNQPESYFDGKVLPQQNPRESPAPMTPGDGSAVPADTSIAASGKDGAHVQAMAIRGYSPQHRNNSVASFDSLATSYNSQDGGSMSSGSTENLLSSPYMTPSSYPDSISAARRGQSQSPYAFNTPNARRRQSSHAQRQPYPGVWRRTKRWAREAGKVFALVDEFCQTSSGREACKEALAGTALDGVEFSPFPTVSAPRTSSKELGTTLMNLQVTLLAIAAIDFPRLLKEMDAYKVFARRWEKRNGASRRVLTHCDTQYSNLLLIKDGGGEDVGTGMPRNGRENSSERQHEKTKERKMFRQRSRTKLAPYERLIVIDFEYCSPNPRAYDIANAFHEWRFDYHSETESWSPYVEAYPTRDEQRRWLRAYVEQGRLLRLRGKTPKSSVDSSTPSTPVADELTLPPAVLAAPTPAPSSTPPQSSMPTPLTESEVIKAQNTDPLASPAALLGGRNKSFSLKSVASPSMAATSSPNLNPTASPVLSSRSSLASLEASMEREIDRILKEVEVFSVACHASWALWGITFAKEQIEAVIESTLRKMGDENEAQLIEDADQTVEAAVAGSAEDFDNLRYALARVELFREEIAALGVRV